MAEKFPRDIRESIGQFQVVQFDETPVGYVRTGTLRLESKIAELEVSPEMTPSIQWERRDDGSWVGHSSESEQADLTVIGTLSHSPGEVSLWRTNTFSRRRLGFAIPGQDNPGNQKMRADWCITGAHLADPTVPFSTVSFDIANLHEWAGRSYTSERISVKSKNGLPHTWTLDFPEADALPLERGSGTLEFSPRANATPRSARGFHVSTNTFVKIELEQGLSLDELVTQYGRPIALLMTLLSGKESSIRAIEIKGQDNRALDAYGKIVDREAPTSPGELFLTRGEVKGDLLTTWLRTAVELSPVPEILASLWSGAIPFIETRSLTLATTAEALHRLLHPDARRFTTQEIEDSISGLADSTMPETVKTSIYGALNSYWSEKSYPQRIEELAEPIAEAVPTCIGKLNRWKQAVSNLRVQLAHGFSDQEPEPQKVLEAEALSRSMLWMLTFRLLLHSGVTTTELRTAAEDSERYQLDRRRWNKEWPQIYASAKA